MRRRCQVIIEGKVQDVGLRGAARTQAARLHLGGWIKNEAAGNVALAVEGEAAPVALFLAWLKKQPGYARPSKIVVQDVEPQGESSFSIAR